jgi:hypothetical protein
MELEDAFEVREQHLNLLAGIARRHISIGLGDFACPITGMFMDGSQDFPSRFFRAATRSERAEVTILLAGPVAL